MRRFSRANIFHYISILACISVLYPFAISGRMAAAAPSPSNPSPLLSGDAASRNAEAPTAYDPDTPLNRKLVDAVDEGNIEAVTSLLAQGASADTRVGYYGGAAATPIAVEAGTFLTPPGAFRYRDSVTQRKPIFDVLVAKVRNPSDAVIGNGQTILMAAAQADDVAAVKTLLDRGATLNGIYDANGQNALVLSIGARIYHRDGADLTVIGYLLDHGADVNARSNNGETALLRAIDVGRVDIVKILLAHGADPNICDASGNSPLVTAKQNGDEESVQLLAPVTVMDAYEAAEFGNVARLSSLLAGGQDPNVPDKTGNTLLSYAAMGGDVKTITLLLDHGAEIKATSGSQNLPVIDIAAMFGNAASVGLLLDRGADINAGVDNPKFGTGDPEHAGDDMAFGAAAVTPLICATLSSKPDVVALLLTRGVDLKRHHQGDFALCTAIGELGQRIPNLPPAHMGRPAPPEFLKSRQVEVTRIEGYQKIVMLLLNAGLDLHSPDSHALYEAAKFGQADIVKAMLDNGADANDRGSHTSDQDSPALLGAINAYEMEVLGRVLADNGDTSPISGTAGDALNLLIDHGADVNLADDDGQTPLMLAISCRLTSVASMLLAHGAKIDAIDADGHTPLMRAAMQLWPGGAKVLLDHGADPNKTDVKGFTPLMLSVDYSLESPTLYGGGVLDGAMVQSRDPGSYEPPVSLVQLLLTSKNVNHISKNGWTALKIASKYGFTRTIKILKQHGAR